MSKPHHTENASASRSWLPLVLVLAVLILAAVSMFFFLEETVSEDPLLNSAALPKPVPAPSATQEKQENPPSSAPENLGGGWWEESRSIYNGIPVRVKAAFPDKSDTEVHQAFQEAWRTFDRVGMVANAFNPQSELGRLNALEKKEPVSLGEDLAAMIKTSRLLFEKSDGAFDPSIWPLKELWRQAVLNQVPPTDEGLSVALKNVGFDALRFEDEAARVVRFEKPALRLDLGGIAKGYAVDVVKAALQRCGAVAGLVQLGGEIAAFGKNRDAKPWRFGVQHPKDMKELWATVSSDKPLKVSTSGNYRQPLKIAGTEYYHIFDPKTGKPVDVRVLGVTTLDATDTASNALLDGAATAITVLGPEKGLAFAVSLGIEALVLTEKDGRIEPVMTEGFRAFLNASPEPVPSAHP